MADSTSPLFPRPPELPSLRVCAECGRSVPVDESIVLSGSVVCAPCKPAALARLAGGQGVGSAGLWRDKRAVVLGARAELPDRCVKCNAPGEGRRLKRNLYWHPPAWYLLILVNLLVYAVAALAVRKRATIEVGLCEAHRIRRWMHIGIAWGFVISSVASFFVAANQPSLVWLVGVGVLAILTGAIWGVAGARTVYALRIDERFIRLGGCGRAFREGLPDFPGERL